MTTKERISELLKSIKPTAELDNVSDIIDGAYLDSMELMGLITGLDDEFSIEIGLNEIVPENFNSIDAMASMVERLL